MDLGKSYMNALTAVSLTAHREDYADSKLLIEADISCRYNYLLLLCKYGILPWCLLDVYIVCLFNMTTPLLLLEDGQSYPLGVLEVWIM